MIEETNTWTLVKPSQDDQRIWVHRTGYLYIADHSGDAGGNGEYTAAPVRNGTPEHTDDGPLRIDTNRLESFGLELEINDGRLERAEIPIFVERKNDEKAIARIDEYGAFFLSNMLGIPMHIKSGLGFYKLDPFTKFHPEVSLQPSSALIGLEEAFNLAANSQPEN